MLSLRYIVVAVCGRAKKYSAEDERRSALRTVLHSRLGLATVVGANGSAISASLVEIKREKITGNDGWPKERPIVARRDPSRPWGEEKEGTFSFSSCQPVVTHLRGGTKYSVHSMGCMRARYGVVLSYCSRYSVRSRTFLP